MDFPVRFAIQLLQDPTQRKHFFRWIESFRKNYFLTKKQPWIVFDAIDFLNSLPLENKRVFEYGSGGSTLFWLSRNMSLVSVEHDPAWFELVRARLKTSDAVDYRLAEPDKSSPGLSSDIADPRSYLSDDAAFRGYSFKNYASQIDAFPDDYFDVVLIDGRARPACIMHSVPKIKTGGLLIVDNSDRKYYFEHTKTILEKFRVIVFRGVTPTVAFMSSTTVFIKVD